MPDEKERLAFTPDHRGVTVWTIKLSIFATATNARWRGVVEALNLDVQEQEEPRWMATCSALQDNAGAQDHYLELSVHNTRRAPDRAHWLLESNMMPAREPPKRVTTSSQRVGGYRRVLDRIAELWPQAAEVTECTVEITVNYVIPVARWRSILPFPRRKSLDVPTHGGQIVAMPQSTAWSLNPPCGIVESVTETFAVGGAKMYQASGKWGLPIQGDFLAEAETRVWESFRPLLVPVGGESE